MAKAKVCVLVAVLALASTAAAIETWTATLEQRLGKTKTTELAAKKAAAKKGAAAAYHWGYEKVNGPKTWAVKYPDCGKKQQSPIDIITKKVDQTNHKQPFQMRLPTVKAKTLQILNNGHTIEVAARITAWLHGSCTNPTRTILLAACAHEQVPANLLTKSGS